MSEKKQKEILGKLLLHSKGKSRLWAAMIALCVGTTLLLVSVMIWWNFQQLLNGKGENDSLGSTFLTVSKKVTDETMGRPELTLFSSSEISDLKNAPEVQDVGALISNHFAVYASLNDKLGFATEMFLEAAPDRFIDKMPSDWHWSPGNTDVPIILSSEFLNLYNYGFALSRGLPQLSESSVQSLSLNLKIAGMGGQAAYTAHVVGFSDRISSVLVPESFIQYGNRVYGANMQVAPSRLIVKTKDPSDEAFVHYLKTHNYITNAEQLRWNKVRAIVAAVSGGTGILALLLMGIGTLVFILFIELTIARAQQSLSLLLQIGYSPRYLTRYMSGHFIPLVLLAMFISVLLATGIQAAAAFWTKSHNLSLSLIPGWPVWVALVVSCLLLLVLVRSAIGRAIRNT